MFLKQGVMDPCVIFEFSDSGESLRVELPGYPLIETPFGHAKCDYWENHIRPPLVIFLDFVKIGVQQALLSLCLLRCYQAKSLQAGLWSVGSPALILARAVAESTEWVESVKGVETRAEQVWAMAASAPPSPTTSLIPATPATDPKAAELEWGRPLYINLSNDQIHVVITSNLTRKR